MHLDKLYWLQDSLAFRKACRTCRNIIQPQIERVLRLSKSPATTEKREYTMMENIARSSEDVEHLRDTAMGMLLAGRDTTAALLSWTFYHLARNPVTFNELRQVVIDDFGTREQPKEVTFESLKTCRFLQWCLFEALRLHPPVPLNARNAAVDTVLPRGGGFDGTAPVFIPKVSPSLHLSQ